VFPLSKIGTVSSNTAQNMAVCVRLFCVCVVLCVGNCLTTADPPSKEAYLLCKRDYGTEEELRAQQWAVVPLISK
jgi:hypothetical protein